MRMVVSKQSQTGGREQWDSGKNLEWVWGSKEGGRFSLDPCSMQG